MEPRRDERRRQQSGGGRRLSRSAWLDEAASRHVWAADAELEPLGVVARCEARHRRHRRRLEVLHRQVEHVLRLPPGVVHHPQRLAGVEQPGAGLRVHHGRHAGHAAELDDEHRPERRLGYAGPRLHDDPALQRVLGGWPAPERRDRRVLLGRHGRALGEGKRRQSSGFDEQPDEPHAGSRRGQGMDRRQSHRRKLEPGPRLRDVDDLQRCVRWQQDHGCRLARPGTDVLEGRPADDAFGDDAGEHLRLSVGRCGRHGLRRLRQRVRHDEQEPGRPRLRDEVSRRRHHVDAVHSRGDPGREPERLLPADEVPGRDHRELRGQPDLPGACLPDVRELGSGGEPLRRLLHAIDGRRPHVVGAVARERRQRSVDRPVPALGRGRPRRRGRGRVLRPARAVPVGSVDHPGARGRGEYVHQRLAPALQGQRDDGRRGSGRRQRAGLAVRVGS